MSFSVAAGGVRGLEDVDLADFMDGGVDLLGVATLDGRFLQLSERWAEVGFDRQALLERPFIDFVHPDDVERTLEEAEALAYEDSSVIEFDNRYRLADGSYRWLRWRSRSEVARERMFCSARDVTAEHAERAEREALLELLRSTGDAVVQRDRDGAMTWSNPALASLLGYSSEAMAGSRVGLVLPAGAEEREREVFARGLAGETQRYESTRVRADGAVIDVDITCSPVWGADGTVTGVSAILRDVTEAKRLAGEREQMLLDLERSNADLTQFAYVASHDLSEPLRSIGGFLSLLEHRYDDVLDDRGRDYIRRVIAASRRMRDLIDDLLAYSRSSRLELEVAECDLGALVAASLETHREAIASSGATVEVGELPTLAADASSLGQVVDNLIANALKFHREGEAPRLAIGAERVGEGWEVRVDDAGIGIEPRHRERAFEIFKRLHASTEYAGTGIGLSVCKAVVERHGGRIRADDSPLGGSRFAFTIPDAPGSAA